MKDFKQWIIENKLMSKVESEIEKNLLQLILKEKKSESHIRVVGRLITDEGVSLDDIKKYIDPIRRRFTDEVQEPVDSGDAKGNRLAKGEASKQLKCATKMPPLQHKVGGHDEKFDILKSEVAQWLLQQPDIMQYVFTRIKNSGFIVYDQDDNTWTGIDYKKED